MMRVSDRACCQLIRGAYEYANEPSVTWDFTGDAAQTGVIWFIKAVNGVPVVVFPGTQNVLDVFRDLDAFADPFDHSFHGPIHPGAHIGMNVVAATLRDLGIAGKCVVTGHSLGALRAGIAVAELRMLGLDPLRRVVFGEPKPGFERLRTVLAPIPAASYGNGTALAHDLFLDIPLSFWPELYVRPCPLTWVGVMPEAGDSWGPLAWHRIQYYDAGLESCQNGLE